MTQGDVAFAGMDIADTEQAIHDVAEYLERINKSPCVYRVERSADDQTVWFYVELNGKETTLGIILSGEDKKTASVVGKMKSPLSTAPEKNVELKTFADALDFMILHLCPIVCVPRAIYYIIFTLRLVLPIEWVNDQIMIDEADGEFTLSNNKAQKICTFRVVGNDIHYQSVRKNKIRNKVVCEPVPDEMTAEGFDFVQHAFLRNPKVHYTQHPGIARGLHMLLKEIQLEEGQLKTRASQLMAAHHTQNVVESKRAVVTKEE